MARGVKIDNKKIAEVVTSYALTNSYNATAKETGVCASSVKNIILKQKKENSDEFVKVCEQKKETFIEQADRIIDKAMKKLEKQIDNEMVPANHLTTAIGTLIDKKRLVAGESTNNDAITIKMSDEVKELSQ